jgi:quercetin dioxygenase-like cupin family protein
MTTEHRCFCDLAPLYALNVLSESDRAWVEAQIAECPDLALELAEFEAAVSLLPYTAPPVPLAPDLKDRLFQRIGRATPVTQPAPELTTNLAGVVSRLLQRGATGLINRDATTFQNVKWEPFIVPGIRIARLYVDLTTQMVTGLLQAEPGSRYPLHNHGGVEEIFMLQGDLRVGDRVYGSGDYIRTVPGIAHAPETLHGCMFFFRASLENEFLEEVPTR